MDENMAHELFMLDTLGYKYTLKLHYVYCFSTASMVARTNLHVKLHVHFLTWFILL